MKVAIIGCGQLARMMALAGIPLGIRFSFLDDSFGGDTRCVDGLGDIARWSLEMSGDEIYQALGEPDVITFEKEQVDLRLLDVLPTQPAIHPAADALATCGDRHREKQLLDSLSVPNARYRFANSPEQLQAALAELNVAVVVKSTRMGYDGKNQWRLSGLSDSALVPESALSDGVIIEEMISFNAEASLVGARDTNGNMSFYSATENIHQNGILINSIAPAKCIDSEAEKNMQDYMARLMEAMDYVGVLAMECFVTDDGLLVNELAPRVHNSGHWTQQGAFASQFENHIRAISGMSLGSTQSFGIAGMINLLGPARPGQDILPQNASLHWYGKVDKPGRKLGHVNLLADSVEELESMIAAYQAAR